MNRWNSHYIKTAYIVFELNFDIRLYGDNTDLHHWLVKNEIKSWAFITAWNPGSKLKSVKKNQAANAQLMSDLKSLNLNFWPGIGKALEGDWIPEASYFVVDITEKRAMELALRYGQNAFVFGYTQSKPQLIFTDSD